MRRSGHRQWLDATRSFYYSSLPPSSTIDQPGLVDACACASPLMDLVFHPLLFYREQPEHYPSSLVSCFAPSSTCMPPPYVLSSYSSSLPTSPHRASGAARHLPAESSPPPAATRRSKAARATSQCLPPPLGHTKKVGHTVPAKRKRRPPRSQHERPGQSHISLPATVTY